MLYGLVAVDVGVDNDDNDGGGGSNAFDANSLSPIFFIFIPNSHYISIRFKLHRFELPFPSQMLTNVTLHNLFERIEPNRE